MADTREIWYREFSELGALHFHDGNPKRPHYLLTSGKHSSGFCNCELFMEDPELLAAACADLITLLNGSGMANGTVDRVVGPAMGAITIAHEVARQISYKRPWSCLRAYVEKDPEDPSRMIFTRASVKPGERILLVEDVITTAGSVQRAWAAIEEAGGTLLPFIAVLVNRSGLAHVKGIPIIALINKELPVWLADECPLCKEESTAIRPKGATNWKLLTAEYL